MNTMIYFKIGTLDCRDLKVLAESLGVKSRIDLFLIREKKCFLIVYGVVQLDFKLEVIYGSGYNSERNTIR